MIDLSQQIKALRKSLGLSQQELADKAGISRVSIGQIERSNAIPSIPNLQQIASALNGELVIYIQEGGQNKNGDNPQGSSIGDEPA